MTAARAADMRKRWPPARSSAPPITPNPSGGACRWRRCRMPSGSPCGRLRAGLDKLEDEDTGESPGRTSRPSARLCRCRDYDRSNSRCVRPRRCASRGCRRCRLVAEAHLYWWHRSSPARTRFRRRHLGARETVSEQGIPFDDWEKHRAWPGEGAEDAAPPASRNQSMTR